MMTYCCVPFCKSNRNKKFPTQKISFHEFPSDFYLREKWIKSISRKDPSGEKLWIPSDKSVVCTLHFEEHCYSKNLKVNKLLPGSIPTIFQQKSIQSDPLKRTYSSAFNADDSKLHGDNTTRNSASNDKVVMFENHVCTSNNPNTSSDMKSIDPLDELSNLRTLAAAAATLPQLETSLSSTEQSHKTIPKFTKKTVFNPIPYQMLKI